MLIPSILHSFLHCILFIVLTSIACNPFFVIVDTAFYHVQTPKSTPLSESTKKTILILVTLNFPSFLLLHTFITNLTYLLTIHKFLNDNVLSRNFVSLKTNFRRSIAKTRLFMCSIVASKKLGRAFYS